MPGGCSVSADLTPSNKDVLVDLKFERKKGFSWNPLNLLGLGTKFNSGKDIHANDKEELQKRVKDLEKRLCYITEKIDQCEGNKMDDEESPPPRDEIETDQDCQPKKANQNYLMVYKQPKIRRHARTANRKVTVERNFREAKERNKVSEDTKTNGDAKTFWNNSTKMDSVSIPWECKSGPWDKSNGWDKKTVAWENKTAAWEKVTAGEEKAGTAVWDGKTSKWEDLSVDWNMKPSEWDGRRSAKQNRSNAWEKKLEWKEKSCAWQSRVLNKDKQSIQKPLAVSKGTFRQLSDQCVLHSNVPNVVGDLKQWHEAPTGDQLKKIRNLSDEPITKKNIKAVINEAVFETFGKTLQNYFKENLDGYIKKRVESAVLKYREAERSQFPSPPQAQVCVKSAKTSTGSLEDLREEDPSEDTTKENDEREEALADETTTMEGSSQKNLSSVNTDSVTPDSKANLTNLGRNKLSPKTNISWKCKYGDTRTWGVKRAPSYIKEMLNTSPPAETKTLQLLKNHSMKPFPSDRNIQRKFRQKISKASQTRLTTFEVGVKHI